MSAWVITSWVLVLLLTGINVFIFLKLKKASEQMLKMAFPSAKSMGEALEQMQKMMKGFGGAMPGMAGAGGKDMDQKLQAALKVLQSQKR